MVFDAGRASAEPEGSFDLRRALRPRGPDPETMLTRDQAAAALTSAGYKIKEKTLATKASRGGGPVYKLFNRRALYRWADVLAWADGHMCAPKRQSSQPSS
jgi:hypothetical protein